MSRMFSITALLALALAAIAAPVEHIEYSTVTGFFLQDLNTTVPSTFDYTANNFGLINRTYSTDANYDSCNQKTQWQRFAAYIKNLNRNSPRNTDYKVIWFGRHGEGLHNAAESYYGTPAWNCYWSIRDGNATVTWADAHLTANGIAQAQKAHNFWAQEIAVQKIQTPQSFYTSPLYRCLSTSNITFAGLDLKRGRDFVPTVKEFFREGISGHTCDRRSTKTYIHESFPTYKIEEGFSEQDLLWKPLLSETSVDQDIRSKAVLDDVFKTDKNTWLSVTSHSGEIASILRVLDHQPFSLSTGAVIPVFVKAETVSGPAPTTATQAYTPISTCATQPPLPTPTA